MNRLFTLFCLLITCSLSYAQTTKFWVYLKDKNAEPGKAYVSLAALANRRMLGIEVLQYTDVPVTKSYVDQLSRYASLSRQSKWLNAVSMNRTMDDMIEIRKLGFVDRIEPIKTSLKSTASNFMPIDDYALDQIKGRAFKKKGLTGAGVSIGIIDGGFIGADVNPEIHEIFKGHQVKMVKDFVDPVRKDFYQGDDEKIGHHGANVCILIAGETMGIAKAADFYLTRTDDSEKEFSLEEDYWIEALEFLDSLGIRLVNSSLGYSLDFDNEKENHKPEDMDGQTCPISKAAQIGAEKKGMIIVVSAGNEGRNEQWGTLTAPADARGVISVGATDQTFLKRDLSSYGPTNLSYLKPDLACYSMGGTSFSAPIITAMIACMLQKNPSLTNVQVVDILKRASNLYPYGNNFIGYGVPNAEKVLALLDDTNAANVTEAVDVSKDYFSVKVKNNTAVAFHKGDEKHVLNQEEIAGENGSLKVKRFPGASRTTILLSDKTIEITWK
jgi:subtilisin family serine protease